MEWFGVELSTDKSVDIDSTKPEIILSYNTTK